TIGGLQEVVDLLFSNADAAVDHALLQLADGQLSSDLFTQFIQGKVLTLQVSGQLLRRHLVALSDAHDGLIDFFCAGIDVVAFGQLQLDSLENQLFQNLFFQHFFWRQLTVLRLQSLEHRCGTRVKFTLKHQVLIHNGNHAIQDDGLGCAEACIEQQQAADQAGGDKAFNQILLHKIITVFLTKNNRCNQTCSVCHGSDCCVSAWTLHGRCSQ